ncbi:MAG: hypothetical protein MN733_35230, partial [Nitrososphaera sp.]|nr:hypothetical protein [Nitrososphaera sp.]
YMKSNVTDEQYRARWMHHWNEINIPHPADEMVFWLTGIGFEAEITFRDYEVALLIASQKY